LQIVNSVSFTYNCCRTKTSGAHVSTLGLIVILEVVKPESILIPDPRTILNLHLVTPWLSILEKEFKMLNPDPRFRLWLTSEPHVKFPSILLQSSLKITYETPPGMRNNLQRTFQYVAPQQGSSQEHNKMQLLFILSWFHSIIQERRTYIPQGWVKYYEFSYGDLKAGESILGGILAETQGRSISW